jgi:hypothetical protein
LLCEVAMGNVANFTVNWSGEAYRPPRDYHTIRVMGKNGPNFDESAYIPGTKIVMPVGECLDYPAV